MFLPDQSLLPAFLFRGPGNVAVNPFYPYPSNWSELVPYWDDVIPSYITDIPFSVVSQDARARFFWVQATEWLIWPGIQRFNNLIDLASKLRHADYDTMKQNMKIF